MRDGSQCSQRWVCSNCELVLEPATILKDHRLLNGNKVISVCADRIFIYWLLFAKHDVTGNFASHRAVPLSELDLMTYWQSLNWGLIQRNFTSICQKRVSLGRFYRVIARSKVPLRLDDCRCLCIKVPDSRCLWRFAYVYSLVRHSITGSCSRSRSYGSRCWLCSLIVHVYETCARIIVILFSLNALILILRLVIILAHPEPRFGTLVLALNILSGFIPSLVHLYFFLLYPVFAKLSDRVEVGVWVNTVLF